MTTKKTTSKKQKLIGIQEYIDRDTGELVPMQVVSIEERDFNFHKVWLQHLVNSLDSISNQKLRLAFWIIDNLNKENQLVMTQRQIADKSGMSLKTVSRTMQALQEGDPAFLIKLNMGAYTVNPEIIWKGSHNNRMGVVFDYNQAKKEKEDETSASSKESVTETDTSVYTDVCEADEGEEQELDGQTTMLGVGVEMSAKAHTD